MKIGVCIKQVPDTSDIKWSENNTIIREGLESILNPYDAWAVDFATKIGAENITAFSMGPKQAESVLQKAIALGVDEGVLICDKRFSGSDTIATSKVLASVLAKSKLDLIVCGQFAIDGDTAQTPPMIAQKLGFNYVGWVEELVGFDEKTVTVKSENEIVKIDLPAVVSVLEQNKDLPTPKISGYVKAHNAKIQTLTLEDLNLSADEVGIKGSPTYVKNVFRPIITRDGKIFENTDEFAEAFFEVLK